MNILSASLPSVSAVVIGLLVATSVVPRGQSAAVSVAFADVRSILDALRADLLPSDLRGRTAPEVDALWPEWVSRRDAAIRARVEAGDEDSIIHLLLFGTSFTRTPRASDRDLANLASNPAEGLRALRTRVDDFAAAIEAPGSNERLQFARGIVERKGIDLATGAGRMALRRYLDERAQTVGGSVLSATVLDPTADLADRLTVFRDRGLSADTSIFIDLGIERALDGMKTAGVLTPGSVRRAAIVGPGLDFTDKLGGYDFYPEQTIQPFALMDALLRLDLAGDARVEITALDLSPRVLRHLEGARDRARTGVPYSLVLPRDADRAWSPELLEYWRRLGNWVGSETTPAAPPPGAGRVEVRGVLVRPPVVLSVIPVDLNIVTERLDRQFDLVVATNILLYYDVFEQSLAGANIASMLRPGGVLLTNNRIFELPNSPLTGVGFTDVTYMSLPGLGDAGDRVIWYQRQ
jgi:hypothetical protein